MFSSLSLPSSYDDDAIGAPSTAPYTPLATDDFDTDDPNNTLGSIPKQTVALSASDKWRLVKPLLPKYMFPLCKSPLKLIDASGNSRTCWHWQSVSIWLDDFSDVHSVLILTRFHTAQLEYTINQVNWTGLYRSSVLTCATQGIAPTLVYPVPSPDKYWLISKIIHSIRDYYPLWQVCLGTHLSMSNSMV